MTRTEAEQQAAANNREHADRATHRWFAREVADGWEVDARHGSRPGSARSRRARSRRRSRSRPSRTIRARRTGATPAGPGSAEPRCRRRSSASTRPSTAATETRWPPATRPAPGSATRRSASCGARSPAPCGGCSPARRATSAWSSATTRRIPRRAPATPTGPPTTRSRRPGGRSSTTSTRRSGSTPTGCFAEHDDAFSFHAWARQALGTQGLLLGWTPVLRGAVRRRARGNLDRFMAAG